ncbi:MULTISPECIES: hypothetical protein [unclassified Exiguobacterium]|uniref:hypothetical protein n=1 Tax=unclassified Exiguobacterium TaxID=2644629 RepID=UPI001BE9BF43|nr:MULTISPECIES: hypothetical protein [unclassified Exiguobacterium]
MKQLQQTQFEQIEAYVGNHGRALERAKWNVDFRGGTTDEIVAALLAYQNADGGFGNGLEADIQMPDSSSIASAEAILIAYEYDLDCSQPWFVDLLDYFEQTLHTDVELASFWEKVPKQVDDHPHAPWWNYAKEERFSPNPSAIVASAFLTYGDEGQRTIGLQIAKRCLEFLTSDAPCYMHDCFCLQVLAETLQEIQPELWDETAERHLERRIRECLHTDPSQWMDYVAQPLDFVNSPSSPWYPLVEPYVEQNIDYWIDSLNEDGYWQPNFSWGVENELAHRVTVIWRCVLAVKRTKKLWKFGVFQQN